MNTTPRRWLVFCCVVSTVLSFLWCFYEFGWEPIVVAFGSLTALVGLIAFPNNTITQDSRGFSAGKRLKWCRKQFRLTPSEMTEQFGIESENQYQQMENGHAEVPLETLCKVSELRGVSIEWLKHGSSLDTYRRWLWANLPHLADMLKMSEPQWQPYEVQSLTFYNKETVIKALKKILSSKPEQLYFAINPNCCSSVYLISQHGEYYTLWNLHALDFWNEYAWASDLNYIPYIYALYRSLIKRENLNCEGVFLNYYEMRALYLGNAYPENIIRAAWIREHKSKRFSNIHHWPEDLLDYKHEKSPASNYQAWYGEWIIKAQGYFKRYLKKPFHLKQTGSSRN